MTGASQPTKKSIPNKVVTRSQRKNKLDIQVLIQSDERESKLRRELQTATSDVKKYKHIVAFIATTHRLLLKNVRKHLASTRKVEASLLEVV